VTVSENADFVIRGFEAADREGWQALVPLIHSEFELITTPDVAMEPDTYRGEEGLRRYFESFEDAMDDIRFRPEGEPIEAGEQAVVPFRLYAKGKETGIEVEQPAYMVWTIRDGKALRAEVFAERARALEAAGLEPDA
jgi:ketosteroid isomerase-like protein